MKKIFTFILGVGTMLCANAQMAEGVQARIYAYDLQQEETTSVVNNTTVKAYNFTFKTNTAAAGTPTVTLFGDGLNDVVIQATATDNTNKSWTATVHAANGEIVAGSYNWKVTVSADPVKTYTQLNQDGTNFSFYRPYGVVVDQSPESDNFGRVYVSNNYAGTARSNTYSRATTAGIYTFNPELTPLNDKKAYSCSVVGDGTISGGSPQDLNIDIEGNLYLADNTPATSGIYLVEPNNEFQATAIFTGTRDNSTGNITNTDGDIISSRAGAVGVYGSGSERKIYTISGTGNPYNVNRYDIGTAKTWGEAPSWTATTLYDGTIKVQVVNINASIEPIKTGGYWIAQYRGSSSKANPGAFYCNSKNEIEYSSDADGGVTGVGSRNGALAVCENAGLVAYSLGGKIGIMSYTVNDDNTITVGDIYQYQLKVLNRANALAFDYAGNLYAVTSTTEAMEVATIPTDNNICTTPAKSTLLAVFSDGDKLTSIDGINADANAPVEYYNLQGVKVENPEKGIFIKKQGSKTTKVVF